MISRHLVIGVWIGSFFPARLEQELLTINRMLIYKTQGEISSLGKSLLQARPSSLRGVISVIEVFDFTLVGGVLLTVLDGLSQGENPRTGMTRFKVQKPPLNSFL